MKLLFKKLLSLHQDGACCFFLILDEQFTILLDCGISHSFDFSKYRQAAAELKNVQLVLISHSTLEYSGAYPFLISELGLSPKIFYTTQPIMRYCPLNIHEEILNLRLPGYNKKIFNRIYSYFEEMQLLKPFQKKQLQLVSKQKTKVEQSNVALKEPLKTIQFCCYLAGGTLGSLYWRISFGLINIMYLVQYNNYSLHHIGGLDFDSITSQSTHLLITDAYPRNFSIKQKDIYLEIKQLVLNFYRQNYIDPNKPKSFNPEHDQKLVIACYPNELIAEVLFILRKIVQELQEGITIEKIGAIHLSKRFLQLVKSQSQYFTNQFKVVLQKVNDYFQQTIKVENRLNVCSINSISGVLSSSKNVQVYYIGSESNNVTLQKSGVINNLKAMRIFEQDQQRLLRSATKLSASKIESKMEVEQKVEEEVSMQAQPEKQNIAMENNEESEEIGEEQQTKNQRNLTNKYIAIMSGIPKFNLNKREKDEQITQFGLRHHAGEDVRPVRQTIYQYRTNLTSENFEEMMMSKKQSKIEVMNIEFSLPPEEVSSLIKPQKLNLTSKSFHRTEFTSSLRVIHSIKPKDIIFVNMPRQPYQMLSNYQNSLNQFSESRKMQAYDSNVKKLCYLSYNNELLEYKMNYLPQMQQNKVQRVKGTIEKRDNILHIHLDCLQDKEIANFRLEKFYSQLSEKMNCKFIGFGIQIEGIKIYRKDNVIIMEGEYSDQFFKVRKQLYLFLGIR